MSRLTVSGVKRQSSEQPHRNTSGEKTAGKKRKLQTLLIHRRLFQQHRPRREELNVSKSFPLYPHNRKSAPISNTSG
jgi:hypothetical protein